MHLPALLKKYQSEAEEYLAEKRVRDIEFSGPTYQVQVIDKDTEEPVWAFLQLEGRGHIKDCFCSCEASEEGNGCVHIATAYAHIYRHHTSPLHQRFERSLWNKLCRLYADRMGYDTDLLQKKGKDTYLCSSIGGKVVFSIKGKTHDAVSHLKEIIQHRQVETEETSLKFSNLSQDEIMLWREGKPSSQLSYELSFWNDISKWLLLQQEEGDHYKISFDYAENQLPNRITANFDKIEIMFYISEANLPNLIPALATIHSPLKVHNAPAETIRKIIYDKENACLLITPKEVIQKKLKTEKSGVPLCGWLFVPKDGFYVRNQNSLLANLVLSGKQVSQALNEHFHVIEGFLQGARVHEDPVQVSYAIAFDTHWNLHLTCYMFNPGDLTLSSTRNFGDWVYLDEDGFYKVEGMRFPQVETVVPADEVSDFIQQHRSWLNTQEGFQTHITSVEAMMTYHVSHDNHLSFERKVALEAADRTKDFGPWVYISGQGFYSKVTSNIGLPLRPGIALSSDQIPLFIRMNREELTLVPGFFSQATPVTKTGLNIELGEEDNVTVTPVYELAPEYQNRDVRYFDDFVFVAGEGFHELPIDNRLPEQFRRPITIEHDNLPLFLTYELITLRRYAARVDPRLIKPDLISLEATSIIKNPSGKYLLKLRYQTERGSVPVTFLWHDMKKKKRFHFSEGGLFDLEEKRFYWLKGLAKNQVDRRSHTLELSTMELIKLNAFESISIASGKSQEHAEARKLLEELTQFRIPEEPDLSGLNCPLRPYQILGVRWLWFLYEHNLSGLLCDDMGLGKTHQAMALIAAILNRRKLVKNNDPCHFLVVCPTSVIYHWQEKLQKFLPGVRICTFHGSSRSIGDFHRQYDILLTSYGIWRIENELLSKVQFELAIFDEIQIAKNHTSRIYASLVNTKSVMRLGLTGTPIENHLRELKSLFDIVLPTYMPSETDFRDFFVKPIEKEGNAERRLVLIKLIRPFVLRRKKEDVLLDLPEKIEEISHCELSEEQEKLYLEVLNRSKQKIIEELKDDKQPIPYVHIFALLSSLKQICDHPAVFHKKPSEYKEFPSGKWDLFLELLGEARESQQKVVVFSQYLTMLDIIEEYLKETGIGFAKIRGATLDRAEQLQRFNHDPDCEVFIGSLQAAGLGVDLTAGSVVIHYDRWWNAARENQATDRVHRIGQTRGVQVFKLVTLGTFEEKIDLMIERKGKMMEEIVAADDQQIVKQFSRDEIIQLLQYVESRKL